jgi:radical SAM superfamily enzyme YgiQ (UPF0313 family)
MKVTLVHPAGSNWIPGRKDLTMAVNRMVPTGLLSIAAYLEKFGHQTSVYDCLGPDIPSTLADRVKEILQTEPEMVGFSATTSGFLDAYDMASAIKSTNPNLSIVFGGVHVSAIGGELLEKFPAIDFLVMGEGEETITALARGDRLDSIDGLAWRRDGVVIVNKERDKIEDLDSLPFPAYEKILSFPHKYRLPPFSYIKIPGASISTSRGCVYRCDYCVRSVFKNGFRCNSAEYTYDHLKMLRQRFSIRHVNVYDDLFTLHRDRVLDLCERLAKSPIGVNFNCAVRIGHVDDDLLLALKKAGCLMVSIGVESGDPELLKNLKSGVTLDAVKETVTTIQRHKLRVKGLFMAGVIGETPESFQRTSDFIMSLGLDDMNLSKFTPFPGAPCFSSIRRHGTFEEDWRQMNALNFVFVPNAFSSRQELDRLYNTHVERFYKSPDWRRKFRKRLFEHRHTLLHILRHLPEFIAAKNHFKP